MILSFLSATIDIYGGLSIGKVKSIRQTVFHFSQDEQDPLEGVKLKPQELNNYSGQFNLGASWLKKKVIIDLSLFLGLPLTHLLGLKNAEHALYFQNFFHYITDLVYKQQYAVVLCVLYNILKFNIFYQSGI